MSLASSCFECRWGVFKKKSRRTPKTDIDLAKQRYREARDG
jgi:hypothetical protein